MCNVGRTPMFLTPIQPSIRETSIHKPQTSIQLLPSMSYLNCCWWPAGLLCIIIVDIIYYLHFYNMLIIIKSGVHLILAHAKLRTKAITQSTVGTKDAVHVTVDT